MDLFSRYTALRCNASLGALRPEGDLQSHEKLNKQRTRYIEALSRGAERQQIRTTAERWHENEKYGMEVEALAGLSSRNRPAKASTSSDMFHFPRGNETLLHDR